ncbi:ankyrin repeat domain-containing protein [Legionella waltersii]|uniref:Ankyrin repeat protein n=1 Tax=Legionella waltersii TaxID=66969 RepID=A0A0W1ABW7_9GAMM|nr:ankyrin repeat domain-containing protein [Legionella waltersii]KTD78833.1 Ankyrin repeat protein [Legionella waltersii]SNV10910.1 Ankyrin repeat protein [Legionella waltersii]
MQTKTDNTDLLPIHLNQDVLVELFAKLPLKEFFALRLLSKNINQLFNKELFIKLIHRYFKPIFFHAPLEQLDPKQLFQELVELRRDEIKCFEEDKTSFENKSKQSVCVWDLHLAIASGDEKEIIELYDRGGFANFYDHQYHLNDRNYNIDLSLFALAACQPLPIRRLIFELLTRSLNDSSDSRLDKHGYSKFDYAAILNLVDVLEFSTSDDLKVHNNISPLRLACRYGQLDAVKSIINKVEWTTFPSNALKEASRSGHLEVVRYLCEMRNRLKDFQVDDLNESLLAACTNGHLEVVRHLLDLGASIEAKDNQRNTPFILACQHDHLAVADLLFKAGAKPNAYNLSKEHALNVVLKKGYGAPSTEMIEFLLNLNLDLSNEDNEQITPLQRAFQWGNIKIIDLISQKAPITSSYAQLILHSMAWDFYSIKENVIDYLIQKGANPNQNEASNGRSPLMAAILNNNLKLIRALVNKGADLNKLQEETGLSPLHYACRNSNLETIKLLLELGANPNIKDKNGNGVFFQLEDRRKDRGSILQALIKEGFNINEPSCYDETPLLREYSSFFRPREDLVSILLDHDADLNVVCKNPSFKDQSLFTLACERSDLTMIKKLFKSNENVLHSNKQHQFSKMSGKHYIQSPDMALLLKHFDRINDQNIAPHRYIYNLLAQYSRSDCDSNYSAMFARFFTGHWGNHFGDLVYETLKTTKANKPFASVKDVSIFFQELSQTSSRAQLANRNKNGGTLHSIITLANLLMDTEFDDLPLTKSQAVVHDVQEDLTNFNLR